MAYANEEQPPARRFWTDSWNGYPAARSRLMRQLHDNRVANPIVLSGDIHAFVVSDLHLDPANPETPRVASELVTTSITSQPAVQITPRSLSRLQPGRVPRDGCRARLRAHRCHTCRAARRPGRDGHGQRTDEYFTRDGFICGRSGRERSEALIGSRDGRALSVPREVPRNRLAPTVRPPDKECPAARQWRHRCSCRVADYGTGARG